LASALNAHLAEVCVINHSHFSGYLEAQILSDVLDA